MWCMRQEGVRTLNNAEATAGVAVGVGVGVGGAVALDEDGGARLKVSKLNRLGHHDICQTWASQSQRCGRRGGELTPSAGS